MFSARLAVLRAASPPLPQLSSSTQQTYATKSLSSKSSLSSPWRNYAHEYLVQGQQQQQQRQQRQQSTIATIFPALSFRMWNKFSTMSPSRMTGENDDEDDEAKRGELITFINLNNLADNPGAVKKKRRVGRGIGSSKGKTCGRGHKGQKARSGGSIPPSFEGGQTRLFKLLPKRGFNNVHAQPMIPINVGTLQDYVDMGRLIPPGPKDPPLTIADLVNAGITKKSTVKYGVKLLAKGRERLRTPLRIEISRASSSAIAAIEAVGGEISTVHYNRLSLKALLKPHRFERLPRRAKPPPKLMKYYTNYENRGYLSAEMQLRQVKATLDAIPEETTEDVEKET